MFLTKMKMLVTGFVVLAFLGTGAGVLTYQAQAQPPFTQNLPAAQPAQKGTPPSGSGGGSKVMDPVQMKREIERLRLELEQTRLLLKLANKEILELRARLAEARDREKIRAIKPGLGGGVPPPDDEAPRKAAEEEVIRKAAARALAEIEAQKAKNDLEVKKAQEQQPGKVQLMVFSPDQKIIAAALDRSINIVDVSTRKEIRRFQGHSHTVTALAFAPDGKRLASGSKDKSVILWDLATGKVYAKILQQNPILTLTFSQDGRSLVIGHNGQTTEIDVATGKVLRVQEKGK